MTENVRFKVGIHIHAHGMLLRHLITSGRNDPVVLAVMLTEMYFRPPSRRLLEYAALICLKYLGSTKRKQLTLGLAQLNYPYWQSKMDAVTQGNLVRQLAQMRNPLKNYDLCQAYLVERNCIGLTTLNMTKVAAEYTGEVRAYHLCFLELTWQQLAS